MPLKSSRFWGISLLIGGILIIFGAQHVQKQSPEDPLTLKDSEKITGLSFVGTRDTTQPHHFERVKEMNAQWVSLMPYAFCRKDSSKIWFDVPRQWWGERSDGVSHCVALAKEKGLKVMLKPHIWIARGGFTGHLTFDQEASWQEWEQTYEAYILHFARLADSLDIEMYCIGTELEKFVQHRPQFWEGLIPKIRALYKGKLTYAENWDAYQRFPFWEDLDYIGVDAYFPLSEEREPKVKTIVKAWEKAFQEMKAASEKYNKPILFTEYGYRSIDYTTRRPWESYTDEAINERSQLNALEALYQRFSGEAWFAGGFLWKWFPQMQVKGRWAERRKFGYTPQNKPAQELVRKWYGRLNKAN